MSTLFCVSIAACGVARPAEVATPQAEVAGRPSTADVRESRPPDPTPRERWLAPFAVSAAGTVRTIEPRTVVVISADPSIAAGLAEQAAIEERIRSWRIEAAPGSAAGTPDTAPPGSGPTTPGG